MHKSSKGPIRVLVVDNSPSVQELLRTIIDAEPDMLVVDSVTTSHEAVERTIKLKPDLITMDVTIPGGKDGIWATREIMAVCPTPVAIVTAAPVDADSDATFRALSSGAVEVLAKPNCNDLTEQPKQCEAFVRQLRNTARVGVVSIRDTAFRNVNGSGPPMQSIPVKERTRGARLMPQSARLIAIGASTGGPPAIRTVLSLLSGENVPPIVLVQHMGADFVSSFVNWLNESIPLTVEMATSGNLAIPGYVYVAPPDRHLTVGPDLHLSLYSRPAKNYHRPSVDFLFGSVASNVGAGAVGVLLTGMGSDGADGLLDMREAGAVTIAQNKESCVVYGMPKAAWELGAAGLTASPAAIARLLRPIQWTSRMPMGAVERCMMEHLVVKGN